MRFFFRSKQFKVIVIVIVALIAVSLTCIFVGGRLSPQSNIVGTVLSPFKYIATTVSNGAKGIYNALKNGNEIMLRNTELESEIAEVREKAADYERLSADNDFYKKYLDIKDSHPDFIFEPAIKISVDRLDPYKSFEINKGSNDGIEKNDPVITDAGLVGFVSEVGLKTAKISTVLSPDVAMGALDNRTFDSGVVKGSVEFASDGKTKLSNLSRSCTVAIGDYVVTSGEGIFPTGLLIGKISSIGSDEYNTSIFASVEPFVDFDEIKQVMVITEFANQGGIAVGNETGSGE